VLLHEGETYVVEQLDLTNRIISVSKKNVDYHTVPMKTVDLRIVKELEKKPDGALVVSFGIVEVVEQYVGYKTLRYDQIVGIESLDLPPLRFTTTALWFSVPDEAVTQVENKELDIADRHDAAARYVR
jgi:DEAD/DEAH box helicase domain-containing protein